MYADPLPATQRDEVPRVAVIISCFNEGRAVAEAWCSLAGEEPHEAVIVDDGSDDAETLEILAALERAGARVVRRENGGVAAARTTGLAATSAPYVMPLDGDDVLAPGALARLADVLDWERHAMAAWGDLRVFGAIDRIDPKGTQIDPWLLTHVCDLHASLMIRREALDAVGGWHDVVFEDWDLTLALAGHGWSGRHVAGSQVYYRVDAGGRLARAPYERGVAELRARHDRLFRERRRYAATSSAPRILTWLFPMVDAIPGLGAARRAALKDALLRRADPRRRVTTPPAGTPAVVRAARRAADELLAADAGLVAQAGASRQ